MAKRPRKHATITLDIDPVKFRELCMERDEAAFKMMEQMAGALGLAPNDPWFAQKRAELAENRAAHEELKKQGK